MKRLSVPITDENAADLARLAELRGSPVSQVSRELLADAIDRNRPARPALWQRVRA